MALNSSGPISLGGSTVGQSVNLELGQAATALTSLNATNVRTLLQVSSGQISLSNAYGKSNITAWLLYVGVPASTVVCNSFYVTPNGYSAINVISNAKTACFVYINDSGTVLNTSNASYNYGGNSFGGTGNWGMAGGNNLNSGNIFPLYWDTSRINTVASTSSNSMAWYGGTALLNVPNGSGTNLWSGVDSSGNVVFTKYANQGKSGYYIYNTRFNSSGTNTAVCYVNNGFPDTAATISVAMRTDGKFVNVFGDGTTYIVLWSTSCTRDAQYQLVGYYGRWVTLNSSDNSLLITTDTGFIITNSAYTSYTAFGLTGNFSLRGGSGYNLFGAAYYNGYYYMATNTNNLNVKLSAFVVFAVNASTGALYWSKKFTINSGVPTEPFTYQNSRASIYANAKGVFVAFQTSTPTTAFVLNIPLSGGLSNATYSAVNGGSVSMTTSDVGLGVASIGSGSISSSGTYGWGNTGTSSSTQTTNPNNQDPFTFSPKTTIS